MLGENWIIYQMLLYLLNGNLGLKPFAIWKKCFSKIIGFLLLLFQEAYMCNYQGHDKHQNQDNDYLGDGGWGGDTGSFNHICNFSLRLGDGSMLPIFILFLCLFKIFIIF